MRFPIRFDGWFRRLTSALLIRPADCFLELAGDAVDVRMGWAFRARFTRVCVSDACVLEGTVTSRGVHGWNGRWLVNGSGDRIVSIDLQPVQRARVLGVPVRLRQLAISVENADALVDHFDAAKVGVGDGAE